MSDSEPSTSSSGPNPSSAGSSSSSSPPKDRLGSVCSVKKLYHGGKSRPGQSIWLDTPQRPTKDLNTCDETLQHAIVLRYTKTQIPNQYGLQEMIFRSRTMQNLLKPHITGFASYHDEAEKGTRFTYPFAPLSFSWNSIELALREQEEGKSLNGMLHASLLRRTLVETFDGAFQKYRELIAAGEITFDLVWTLFKPGCDIFAMIGTNLVAAKCDGLRSTKTWNDGYQHTVTWRYLAWDGKDYGWTTSSSTIAAFSHRMKISELPVYPTAHDQNKDEMLTTLARRGRVFARLTCQEPHMMMYSGSYMQNDDGRSCWLPRRSIKTTERLMLDTAAYNRYGPGSVSVGKKATMDAQGTGKTLTAEALAEEMRRPLYSVSASELDYSAGSVESSLQEAFDLAARWKALILLDEADVFLEKRSDNELERNKVVSVFLRKLEYFNSMVFLTTNRPDSFDEAFRSRIHVAIKYKDLTVDARRTVWNQFVTTAEDSAQYGVNIEESDIDQLAKRHLNGREIRSLVKSALLLAWSAQEPMSLKHIDVVWRIEHASDCIAG
ncbi:hypothetical protein LTR70_003793 [Exophiala xenobiotica]|uniref:AAA+ ATPase domain-containing protein n=1 Tax=Lithohypha guttulata TaxID=1690604 RepID=A0ABR0KF59_9EURO|nr:hypothetical protein LTR24_003340 [Lithohypha guttulata]KAK5322292.1 hypothetical protein LTR70_003793 [Exophiala xenobiotica]